MSEEVGRAALPPRAAAMEERLLKTARRLGLGDDACATLARAHALAMSARVGRIASEHDPDFLHPGRTMLLLMLDAQLDDAASLAAAALVESRRAELRVPPEEVEARMGTEIAELVAAVPVPAEPAPGAPSLAEALVTADPLVALLALAERLDQLRHAHLWPDREERRRAHEEAEAVYLAVAERTHPVFARRYAWWCGMFGKRHL